MTLSEAKNALKEVTDFKTLYPHYKSSDGSIETYVEKLEEHISEIEKVNATREKMKIESEQRNKAFTEAKAQRRESILADIEQQYEKLKNSNSTLISITMKNKPEVTKHFIQNITSYSTLDEVQKGLKGCSNFFLYIYGNYRDKIKFNLAESEFDKFKTNKQYLNEVINGVGKFEEYNLALRNEEEAEIIKAKPSRSFINETPSESSQTPVNVVYSTGYDENNKSFYVARTTASVNKEATKVFITTSEAVAIENAIMGDFTETAKKLIDLKIGKGPLTPAKNINKGGK